MASGTCLSAPLTLHTRAASKSRDFSYCCRVTSRCSDVTAAAAANNDRVGAIQAHVDGVEIPDVRSHRERSPACFTLFFGSREEADGMTGYPAATDGYWLMLRPLPVGTHTLKFQAQYQRTDEFLGSMAQDVEYQLLVE